MRKALLLTIAMFGLAFGFGCLNVKAPERISVGDYHRSSSDRVDSSRIPDTATHEEARAELERAYRHIRELERKNDRLRKKLEEKDD